MQDMKSLLNKELTFKKQEKLSIGEIRIILSYLESGYSFNQVCDFLEFDNTEKDAILFFRNRNLQLVGYFLNHIDLINSLKLYLTAMEFKVDFKKKLYKSISYPGLQLILTFILSLVAQNWLFPLLLDLTNSMGVVSENNYLFIFISIVNVLIITSLIFFLFMWFIFNYFESTILFKLLNLKCFKLVKEIIVIKLLLYFNSFYRSFNSFELLVKLMRKIPNERIVCNFMDIIHFRLLEGITLSKTFEVLDSKLGKLVNFGSKTNNLNNLLEIFLLEKKERLFIIIKRIGMSVQLFSYCYIGLIIVLVYQLMLMPLQMVERM